MRRLAIERRIARPRIPTVTAADNPFRRYGEIKRYEVRQADVTGQSFAERVKRTRQMLRSMKPEAVKQVIEFHKGLTFFEALALANRAGGLIVPNDIHDRILVGTKDLIYLRQNYPVWTGTLVIYEAPDKKFGKKVVFSWEHDKVTFSFEVPKQFRGKKNCALVLEHPDFELLDLGNKTYELKVVDKSNIRLVQDFAKENGWYLTDNGIPVGPEVAPSTYARRFLSRLENQYIGPLIRGYDYFKDVFKGETLDIYLVSSMSNVLGVHMVSLATEKSDSK